MGDPTESCPLKAENFDPELVLDFVKSIRYQNKSQELTDITIEVEGKLFRSYKIILSACSGFFRGMFSSQMKETLNNHVALKEISKETFELILESVIDNKNVLDESNIIAIWKASHMLQFLGLLTQCEKFLTDNLGIENVMEIYKTAELFSSKKVKHSCWEYILDNFEQLYETKKSGLLDIPFDQIKNLIEDDDLLVTSEDTILRFIFEWAASSNKQDLKGQKHPNTRKTKVQYLGREPDEIVKLLKSCRLMLVSDSCMLSMIGSNKLVNKTPEVKELLCKCLQWKRDGCLQYNTSLAMSCSRGSDTNRDFYASLSKVNHVIRFFADIGEPRWLMPNDGYFKLTVLTATVCANNVFLISDTLSLFSFSLLNDTGCKLVQENIVNGSDVSLIGNFWSLYIVGKDIGESKVDYIDTMTVRTISTNNTPVPVCNISTAFMQSLLIIFGCEHKGGNLIVQCFDLETQKSYCLDEVRGDCSNMAVFQTFEKTFFIFGNGHLWNIEPSIGSKKFVASYITSLWEENETIYLYSSLLCRDTLVIFCSENEDCEIPALSKVSVPGVCTAIDLCSFKKDYAPYQFFSVKLSEKFCDKMKKNSCIS